MLYNSNSWAAPKNVLEKLDTCQRKHLRQILNMTYPIIITNKALYQRCAVRPLTERVEHARWKMLGHILRSDCMSPAQRALYFAVESSISMKGRVGRHQSNLFKCVLSDLNKRKIVLKNIADLYNLRHIASDRDGWKELF